MSELLQEARYTFALLSDIHIDLEGGGERAYFRMAGDNFADALRVCRERGIDFILSAGDQITAADEVAREWHEYRRIIADSGYSGPIFACFGNHESRPAVTRGTPMEELTEAFLQATAPHRGFDAGDGLYYSFTEPVLGDIFLVTAMEGGMMVPFVDEFSSEQLDWLEARLGAAQREGKRVFLIQHASVYGYGPGDDACDPVYDGSLHTGSDFPNNTRFAELMRKYREIIWMSGHTHVDLRDEVNYLPAYDGGCHMIHVPALCGTTRLVRDESGRRIDRTFRPDTAQGYIVRVYADRAVFEGFNFNTGASYPEYTYVIGRRASIQ